MSITFTVNDPVAFKKGEVININGQKGRWQIMRAWINRDGIPEYEAKQLIDVNRKELRKRLAMERKS